MLFSFFLYTKMQTCINFHSLAIIYVNYRLHKERQVCVTIVGCNNSVLWRTIETESSGREWRKDEEGGEGGGGVEGAMKGEKRGIIVTRSTEYPKEESELYNSTMETQWHPFYLSTPRPSSWLAPDLSSSSPPPPPHTLFSHPPTSTCALGNFA